MSEKNFFCAMLIEGILLMSFGICILVLPKLTSLSFGIMLSGTFIVYGAYKTIISIVNRKALNNTVFSSLIGLYLTIIGILLLFVPKINLLWLIALTGIYFILESLSSTTFGLNLNGRYRYSALKLISCIISFLIGLLIILGLPVMSFVLVTILCGIGFLVKGLLRASASITNIYTL